MRCVNVKYDKSYTHYAGRGVSPKQSAIYTQLGNPFVLGVHGTRAECIVLFEQWARHNAAVLDKIRRLPAKAIIGCWCDPLPCHVSVIIKLWKEQHGLDCADEGCPHYGTRHSHAPQGN